MMYSHKDYKIDNNKLLLLLNFQLRDCCTQYRVTESLENKVKKEIRLCEDEE
jgi:hypothetical protein